MPFKLSLYEQYFFYVLMAWPYALTVAIGVLMLAFRYRTSPAWRAAALLVAAVLVFPLLRVAPQLLAPYF